LFKVIKMIPLVKQLANEYLYRQQEKGMSVNFEKEVLVMDALFGFFEIAGEEAEDNDGAGQKNNGYKLN
jgi:hypothetical protein